MDLLKTLNLEDLPEQQTRTNQLTESQPDFDSKLGFDACCTCGKTKPTIECDGCHRVKYCSIECRGKDSEPPIMDDDEQALGHSAVLCALLSLCNDDEAIEEGETVSMDHEMRSAATDRLASEFESYPATLANIIMDGPCYQGALAKSAGGSLTIHIIGASVDSELWDGHPDPSQESNVFQSYAEALAEISERHRVASIHLCFIGPDCPEKDIDVEVQIRALQKPKSTSVLKATTLRAEYSAPALQSREVPAPDIVVFFNPGFTCPDYSWEEALDSVPTGIPILVTTNTELEGVADVEFLLESKYISELPAGLAIILHGEAPEESDNDTFFSVNPYSGNRVRQSGTMANDLFVKSRWIYGGLFGQSSRSKEAQEVNSKRMRIEGSGNTKKANPALI